MEYDVKDDRRFGFRAMGTALLASIPVWVGLAVAGFWFQSVSGCLVVLAVTLPLAFAVLVLRLRRVDCPQCGRRIKIEWNQREFRRGGMLTYRCPDCRTIWRTYLYPSSDP